MSSNDSWINDKSSKVEFEGLDLPAGIITGILLTFIISITIFGNLLVLIAIYVYHHLRTTTNFFILNLACADLFLGLSVLPFSASLEILGYWPFGRLFCVVWASVDVLLCTASIMTLCVISVDRYIGVTRPLQHSNIMTKKRAYSVIFSVWILSFAISVGPLMGWKPELDPDPRICQVNDQFGYVLFSTAGSFYIPMAIIIFVYIRIYKEAVKHTSQLMAGMKMAKTTKEGVMLRVHVGRNSQYSSDYRKESYDKTDACNKRLHPRGMIASKITKFKREKKAAKTLGIVVGVFILCWFPFFFCLPLGKYLVL
ncbi:hypothetical protein FSP39_005751 [Pinctada imbricata]|uniref:G-protein coupled receptors family 1 profile domain-containing protein n=1 Tax=Pinctada imbricata TaxID=66713 RepID=A0AA88Y5L3_PINIB|nr:hypothetical protein FSP39_005751 [Pinctada imbricata]